MLDTIAVVTDDLITASPILDAASANGYPSVRVERPHELPTASSVRVAFIDWACREPDWGDQLRRWIANGEAHKPRLVIFGPHADLQAHAAARQAALGPMVSRSKLFRNLHDYISGADPKLPR